MLDNKSKKINKSIFGILEAAVKEDMTADPEQEEVENKERDKKAEDAKAQLAAPEPEEEVDTMGGEDTEPTEDDSDDDENEEPSEEESDDEKSEDESLTESFTDSEGRINFDGCFESILHTMATEAIDPKSVLNIKVASTGVKALIDAKYKKKTKPLNADVKDYAKHYEKSAKEAGCKLTNIGTYNDIIIQHSELPGGKDKFFILLFNAKGFGKLGEKKVTYKELWKYVPNKEKYIAKESTTYPKKKELVTEAIISKNIPNVKDATAALKKALNSSKYSGKPTDKFSKLSKEEKTKANESLDRFKEKGVKINSVGSVGNYNVYYISINEDKTSFFECFYNKKGRVASVTLTFTQLRKYLSK